jgi:hypothetical protein
MAFLASLAQSYRSLWDSDLIFSENCLFSSCTWFFCYDSILNGFIFIVVHIPFPLELHLLPQDVDLLRVVVKGLVVPLDLAL